MKRLFLCIVAAGLLAACNGGKDDARGAGSPSAVASQAVAPPTRPAPAPEGQKGVEVLTGNGIELTFPHAINYDILDVSKNGTPRQRVLVEVLGGDFGVVAEQFAQLLVDQGYAMASDRTTGGRIERIYTQKGKPTYYLLMQPVGIGPKLGNPDATGSIHIMWNRR